MYTVRREEFKRHEGGINGLGGRFSDNVAFSVFNPQGKRACVFEVRPRNPRKSEELMKAAAEEHARSLNEFYGLREPSYRTYPDHPQTTGIYEAGVGIARLGDDGELGRGGD